MNIKKSLLRFSLLMFLTLVCLVICTFVQLVNQINYLLIYVDIRILTMIIITIFIALFIPDMKYSYRMKNTLGILLISGIVLPTIWLIFRFRIVLMLSNAMVSFVVVCSIIGIIIGIKDA